ncbi:glycosyltransferase family 4 protein [Anthocerotibacter panamensis]|uniref:glycosyltransferase family 4 protein n=1 Tax=Anthocerotibacter panamensis TaxID=2857077 RepID=UPI001C4088C0|nr:glycosyltransferase family 4 protein [Anthocerotibacter panamensis]
MRIAQIAPLWERVPPPGYGGIELVVSLLTDELVRRGHEVTLFASGDSKTLAHLSSVHDCALRLDPQVREPEIYNILQLSQVYQQADTFDLIHSHVGFGALPFADLIPVPTLHTLHGIFTPDGSKIFRRFAHQPYVSISNAQRKPLSELNYIATVYNGIDLAQYPFRPEPQAPPYLAFLGRMSWEKGPDRAIALARQTGWTLKLAGKVDLVDEVFFHEVVQPQIDGEQIQYLGEISHEQKADLLGGAVATLFSINWEEPFGLVMIEAMACGSPVLGMVRGSAPEVILEGKTGFLVESPAQMAQKLPLMGGISRQACRDHVLARFTHQGMTDSYEAVYRQILAQTERSLTRTGPNSLPMTV